MKECRECGHYIQPNEKLCCPHSLKTPTTRELTGSDPDFTGSQSTDEYIRDIRGRDPKTIADRSCDLVDRLKSESWDVPEMLAPEIAGAMCTLLEDVAKWLESRYGAVGGVGASAIRAHWIQHD